MAEDEEALTDEETFEDQCYESQYGFIKKDCGKEAAEKANYGWGVSGTEDYIDIATKVYRHGVLTTIGHYKTKKIEHRWS